MAIQCFHGIKVKVKEMAARSFDYDSFDYEFDAKPMSLEQAIREATRLGATDSQNFYRVVATDSKMRNFRVQKVSKAKAYAKQKADFASRVAHAFTR
jgi:hypothetical protein